MSITHSKKNSIFALLLALFAASMLVACSSTEEDDSGSSGGGGTDSCKEQCMSVPEPDQDECLILCEA